jgi:hypothetical protein
VAEMSVSWAPYEVSEHILCSGIHQASINQHNP